MVKNLPFRATGRICKLDERRAASTIGRVRAVHLSAVAVAVLVLASCDRTPTSDVKPESVSPDEESGEFQVRPTSALAAIVASRAASPEVREGAACPDGMLLVEGNYCPKVRHKCLGYMDPPGRYEEFRCAEYAQPATCLSRRRVPMRFCIDEFEYTPEGETLPANHMSWTHAHRICSSMGKRVCQESEWNFACEGEEMRPYPYGWKRDASACNADHTDIVDGAGKLKDLRAPNEAYPRCVSPFGVRNLAGNLEEFVTMDRSKPLRPAMKGAFWQPSRNFCRAAQTAHDRYYNGTETGFRCCSEPHETSAPKGKSGAK